MTGLPPPRRFEQLLIRSLRGAAYRDDIVGDLREAFFDVSARRSAAYARSWYRVESLRLAVRFAVRRAISVDSRIAASPAPGGDTRMDRLLIDLRFAVRALAKRKAVTFAVVTTLALAIGANAAVFGVVDALVLHPFAMRDVDRIVMPVTTSPQWTGHRETVSNADFLDWRRDVKNGAIDHLAAIQWWDANLVGRDEPERVLGFRVSPAFFDVMQVRPAIGRAFLSNEEQPANATRVVLSDALWRRRFGGDASIVDRPVLIDGAQWTVVGIMPPGFDFPMGSQVWAPLAFDESAARNRTVHQLTVIGRLAQGRSIADAQAHMTTIVQRLGREHPDTNNQLGVAVLTLSRGMVDVGVPSVLGLWQAAGVFVMLIACANIANLLLARAAERGREVAIRLALGSSRGRILRESLVESGLLVVLSVPPSLAIASMSLRLMHALMPPRIVVFVAGWNRLGLDYRTFVATLACAALAAVTFGIVPAMQMARATVADSLKSDGRAGAGPGRQRTRRGLVIAELALALPLLVAATLSISTVTRYLTGWQGYDPNNVLTVRAILPHARYPDADSRARFASNAIERLRAVAAARDVAAANVLPAIDFNEGRGIELPGQPITDRSRAPRVDYRVVSPRYFDVLRMPVLAGRAFTIADASESEPVAIVSETMARTFWPRGATGERMRISDGPWVRIVGVCGDVVHDWFEGRKPTVYRPLAQAPEDALAFAIRTNGDPLAVVSAVRAAVAQVDPTQPIFDLMPMWQVLSERTISLQYIAGVMGAFAALALLLALLGLYAVMTHLVTQRVREIGVRIALGATGRDVARLTLSQAGRLTAVGIAIGLLLAIALGRLMEAGLLGIVSNDIRMTTALALALAAASLAASYLPARRAASVDPIVALRSE